MDQNTASLIILVVVSIITSVCTSVLQSTIIFMKLIKKSTCFGNTIEMKNNSPSSEKLPNFEHKQLDIILERLEHK